MKKTVLPSAAEASASLLKWPSMAVSVDRMTICAIWVAASGTASLSSSRASSTQPARSEIAAVSRLSMRAALRPPASAVNRSRWHISPDSR